MSPSAPSRARRWSALFRAVRVFLGALLLTTCSTDTVGPHKSVLASWDTRGLISAAADFAIPIDEVVLEIRRASNNEVVVSRTLTSSEFTVNSDELRISIRLDLETNPEDFTFTATARSNGVDYYQASGTVTAVAFTSVSTPAISPQYIGPGANADEIDIPASTALGNGQSATLTADVFQSDALVPGVPVSFSSSDSSLIIPQQQSINSASVTAPATGSGSVVITARTPTGLSTTGTVSWSPQATQLVLIGGNGQTVQPGANAAQLLQVGVLDANNNPVPGVAVDFAVTAGPTGTVVNPTSTVSDDGGGAATTLTAGNTSGPITVTATSAGLTGSPVTFTATVASTVGQPSVVVANSQTSQNTPVGTAVAAPPSVIVRDAGGLAVPNVQVTFAITAGGGTLTGGTQTTNSSGIATVTSWTVGPAVGANTMTATVTGLTPVTFTATGIAGPPASITLVSGNGQTGATGVALAQPLVVLVNDAGGNPVPSATVTWTPSDGSAAPASGPTGTNGHAQTTWTLGANQLTPTLTAAVAGAGSVTFNATTTFPNPTILLNTSGPALVGVGLNNTINITLSAPAGVNGASLTLSSDNTNILTVAPTSLNIPQGQSTGSFTVTGVSAGTTTVRATATGYDPGALPFGATLQIISLPATLNVPFGQNQNFPVSLALAAPAGGVTVTIATTDATHVAVVTNTVSIPAGSQVGTATVFGQFPGPATINATATGFVPASSAATTTALLNIVQGSLTINASFGGTITIELRSGATTVPAPAGGLVVTLTATNPACVTVPATVTIPQGLVNITAPVSYGGSATLPCNTPVTASAPNITSDNLTVTVNQVPTISLNLPGQFTGRLGNGLQDAASGNLQVATPVATTVRLTSGDPASLLLAPDAITPGTPFVDVPVAANASSFSYYTQGVGVSTGAVTITASSVNFSNGTTTLTVANPGIDLSGVVGTTTTLAANSPFIVRIGVPNANNTGLSALQQLRAGSSPVTATITNGNGANAKLVTATDTADQVTVNIALGGTSSPGTVAGGGVALDPIAAGTTAISATVPGFIALPTATANVTINAPNIGLNTPAQFTGRLGNGLQDAGSGTLQNPNPNPVTIRVTSADPAVLLISPNATTVGAAFADIVVPANQTSFSYVVQGIGVSAGTVGITATAPGYNNGTTALTVAAPGVDLSGLPTSLTSFAANVQFVARIGVVNANNTGLSALQNLRAGSSPVTATFNSSNVAVGRLVTAVDTGSPVTASIPLGVSSTPSSVATGGVAFDPLTGGATSVDVSIPGFTSLPPATVAVTISAPNITLQTPGQFTGRLGNGLQDATSGNLQTATPVATTVTLTSGDPSVLLLSPNATTAGSPSIDIPIAVNGSSFTYYTQGVGTSATPVTITATSVGYNNGSTTITVVTPALQLSGLPTALTTFSTTDPFQVLVGVPNAGGTGMSAFQTVRFGSSVLTATVTNSNGTNSQLVTTATTGNLITVPIAIGANSSPSSVALGGVAFDPLVAGSTTVTATIPGFTTLTAGTVNVVISAPTITLNTPGQFTGFVGAGLQDVSSGSFQVATPGALTLHIESSNPSVALVSPNANTAGTQSIDIPIGAGAGSFTFYVQGVEGATGTPQIIATAPGYSTGQVNVQIVQPALQLSGLPTSLASTAATDPFTVVIGVPNAQRTAMAAFQGIRAGGTSATVSVSNSNGAAAQLLSNGQPGNPVTSGIPIGASTTATTNGLSFDPLGQGSAIISATIPTFFALPAATQTVTVTP